MKKWIKAFRLKTLPLAVSNTIVGSALSIAVHQFRWTIFVLATLTAVLLQILSNMANDYGDFKNGKDTSERIGPQRMVQSGEISPTAMLRGMILLIVLCVVCGLALIAVALQGANFTALLGFCFLGAGAIVAAILYTNGKNPFGYRGYGDLFVLIFFGYVGVVGTYFLHTLCFKWNVLLPATSIGFLSVGVLNVNNMRDYQTDKIVGKRTLVVKFGIRMAKIYHISLLVGAVLFMLLYSFFTYKTPLQLLYFMSFPLLFVHLRKVVKHQQGEELFHELGRLSIATLIWSFAFLFGTLFC